MILNFRDMAQFGLDPLLQASLLEVAYDIEMEVQAIETAGLDASTELLEHPVP